MSRRRSLGPSVSFFAFQDIITSVVGIFVLITLIMMLELVSNTAPQTVTAEVVVDTFTESIQQMETMIARLKDQAEFLSTRANGVAGVNAFNERDYVQSRKLEIESLEKQIELEKSNQEQLISHRSSLENLLSDVNERLNEQQKAKSEIQENTARQAAIDQRRQELESSRPFVFGSADIGNKKVVVVDCGGFEVRFLFVEEKKVVSVPRSRLAKDTSKYFSSKCHYFILVRPNGVEAFNELHSRLEIVDMSFGYDLITKDQKVDLKSDLLSTE